MSIEGLVLLVVIGSLGGLLANTLLRGLRIGAVGAIVVGIIGAFLGNWLFALFHIQIPIDPIFVNIIMSFVGSVILLFVLRTFRRA